MRHKFGTMTLVCLIGCLMAVATDAQPLPSAALHVAAQADAEQRAVEEAVHEALVAAGYDVSLLDNSSLCHPETVHRNAFALLALPNAARLPMGSIDTIHAFVKQGGNLLALNAPAWRERLVEIDGVWQRLDQWRRTRVGTPPPHVFLDFADESLEDWRRSAHTMATEARYRIVSDAVLPGMAALEVELPVFDNWDSVSRRFEASPFPEGHELTVFTARGGPDTKQLAIELTERDGSRWIAVTPLSEDWQQYLLKPEDFKFWDSVPEREDTLVDVSQVAMISFTLAYTHTGHLMGAHRFQVAQVGTAPFDDTLSALLEETPPPALDALSPGYKIYDASGVSTLRAAADQTVLPALDYPVPLNVRAAHPRPEASGFDKDRPWRWLPLLEARADDGALRGYPAVMVVNSDGAYANSVWASFAIEAPDWYLSESGRAALQAVLTRMTQPVYLLDGGANFYTYFEDQEARLGIQVVNTGVEAAEAGTATVTVSHRDGAPVFSKSWDVPAMGAGLVEQHETLWKPDTWPEAGYMVRAELRYNDDVIDQATHEIHCWRPRADKSHVTIENGAFMLDGRRWRPHGINYMPSSGIGIEWWSYFEHWVGAAAYHPNVIQRDLERCAAMGFNSLSIFLHYPSMAAQNLLDLLRRMEALGLRANLSLRPGTPMDFPWDIVREMIHYYRLAENDTVFAYDLAWEPQFRDWERDPFNPEWKAWIIERYGSIANAEADWDFPVPRDEAGQVVNFSPHMIGEDGPWTVMLAAYRRFLDTLLYEKYAEARRLVRTIDPHTLVSFRMSMAGDPTNTERDTILYDFAYLAGAVDIHQPEAYGRIGAWDRVKPGWFTYEYARWANPELPVLWAEAGVHVWDMAQMQYTDELLAFQGTYYEDFYRMLTRSGADGIYWWWYPGGFRMNENSDYGIINPDGTNRPVTGVIREQGPAFTEGPNAAPVDLWLHFDRDAHTDGLTGIYTDLEQEFWAAIEAGHTPGLRTDGTDTDSVTCPALAVGNRPLTGANPPKYLDAFFDYMEVYDVDNQWRRVLPGETVAVKRDEAVRARATFTNLGEAALATPAEAGDAPGGVYLTVLGLEERVALPLPQRLTRFEQGQLEIILSRQAIEESTRVTVVLDARDRSLFGQRFDMVLVPEE